MEIEQSWKKKYGDISLKDVYDTLPPSEQKELDSLPTSERKRILEQINDKRLKEIPQDLKEVYDYLPRSEKRKIDKMNKDDKIWHLNELKKQWASRDPALKQIYDDLPA